MQDNSTRPWPDDPRLDFDAAVLKAMIALYVASLVLGV